MNKNVGIILSEFSQRDYKKKEKKPKRIEWLNIYSKGFIIESINNNYINKNNTNKKKFKISQNSKSIIPRNLENNTIKSNISTSFFSSKKTYNLDEEEEFINKNKTSLIYINNIQNSIKRNMPPKSELNNIKKVEKKIIKNNSVKNFKYTFPEKINSKFPKKKNNQNNKSKSIKMNSKLIYSKSNFFSPLLSYLEFTKNNMDKKISFNNNKNKKIYKNNNFFNSCKNNDIKAMSKKEKKEKINNRNKINKKISDINLDSKSLKEIKINNINLIEIQKYMVDGRKFKNFKDKYRNKNDFKGELKDYTFDNEDEDKLAISERKNIISFSEICNMENNITNNKGNN